MVKGEQLLEQRGGEDGRKGEWMHANIYTYSTQAQMHTQSGITVVIHHALDNEMMGAEAFDSSVTAPQT